MVIISEQTTIELLLEIILYQKKWCYRRVVVVLERSLSGVR